MNATQTLSFAKDTTPKSRPKYNKTQDINVDFFFAALHPSLPPLPPPSLTPRDGTPEHCFLLTFTQVIHMVISCTRSPATTLHHRDTSMHLQQLFKVKFTIWLTTPPFPHLLSKVRYPRTVIQNPKKKPLLQSKKENKRERRSASTKHTPFLPGRGCLCIGSQFNLDLIGNRIHKPSEAQSKYSTPIFDLQHASLLHNEPLPIPRIPFRFPLF